MNTFKRFALGAIFASLMAEAEADTSSGGGAAAPAGESAPAAAAAESAHAGAEDSQVGKPFPRPNPEPTGAARALSPSTWVVHKEKGLGMIAGISPSVTVHFVVKPDGSKQGDERAADGALESAVETVNIDDLRRATAAELPKRLGYTDEQLKDYGYA